MKIISINQYHIKFDDGTEITYDFVQDCCEINYANFTSLEALALTVEFEYPLIFELVEGGGFRFGSKNTPMFFIPCYSEQNGYYSSEVTIFCNGKAVLHADGNII
jgi:hypothetical protein